MEYIDSSAFVKYYAEEDFEAGAEKVQKLINDAKRGKVVLKSSVILVGECVSAFDRWLRMGIFDEEKFNKVITEFLKDVAELRNKKSLVLDDISTPVVINCVGYVISHHLSLNDAIHLYTTISDAKGITRFVCADKNLIVAAQREGFEIFDPGQ